MTEEESEEYFLEMLAEMESDGLIRIVDGRILPMVE